MLKKKILAGMVLGMFVMAQSACSSGSEDSGQDKMDTAVKSLSDGEVSLTKSEGGNPIVTIEEDGAWRYGGDPSVLVDGDTVYLYTGHDTSTDEDAERAVYVIKEWLCYSSKDLVNWQDEGVIMQADTESISWASDSSSAWASQIAKHYDKKAGKDRYYLYYCTWDRTSAGKMSIGVAVSDSPAGPFQDKGEPLVRGTLTEPQTSNWNDIDPTVWVEEGSDGIEHRYLAWGNGRFYLCELNEDMMSVKDLNGDGEITCGISAESADILAQANGLTSFTEAPWLYRRQDESGNYYGPYYLFYANDWREKMAYATTDNLLGGQWNFGKVLMPPTSTSNTNHMAVFDFKGRTYFVYHNGSLPGGNGYRRSACITELLFEEDGSIQEITETASGISGTTVSIWTESKQLLTHANFINAVADKAYPYSNVKIGTGFGKSEEDGQWVLSAGKADTANPAYVSIQSENKPGLYITAGDGKTAVLAQDTDASEEMAERQTFHTVEGLNGSGVSFESVSNKGMYLTVVDKILCLTDGSDKETVTFHVNIN